MYTLIIAHLSWRSIGLDASYAFNVVKSIDKEVSVLKTCLLSLHSISQPLGCTERIEGDSLPCNSQTEAIAIADPHNVSVEYVTGQNLEKLLDFNNGGVSKHLGQIADSMYEWEGPVAERLGLTRADIAAIKTKYPGELHLQTYIIV